MFLSVWQNRRPTFLGALSSATSSLVTLNKIYQRTRPDRASRSQKKLYSFSPPVSTTILTNFPHGVEPQDFLSHLPLLKRHQKPSFNFAIFLLTPSLVRWANPECPFFAKSLMHFSQALSIAAKDGKESFTTLVAVVDRLPHRHLPSDIDADQGNIGRNPRSGVGYDGVSLYIDRLETAAPDLKGELSLRAQESSLNSSHGDHPGVLNFRFNENKTPHQLLSQFIQVPLANTLFSNGRLSTMFATQWELYENKATPTSSEFLDTQTITLITPRSSISMHVPLVPLTPPREVISSMGNIVRKIRRPGSISDGVPATSELEQVLIPYAKAVNPSSGRLPVWASICPSRLQPQKTISAASPTLKAQNLDLPVPAGARLHRVVSGGGGWGAKQGLLSLDPEYTYQTSASESPDAPFPRDDGNGDYRIQNAAKAGDFIQFLVSSIPEGNNSDPWSYLETFENPNTCDRSIVANDHVHTRILGVCPSQDDLGINSTNASSADVSILSIPNHFGALSEKGVSVKFVRTPAYDGSEGNNGHPITQGETKVDVPFSVISSESFFPESTPQDQVSEHNRFCGNKS